MKISIITVVFNNDKTIEDAIEYIIIDGASKDKTISVINRYKDRIAKFISESDKGLYDAMNKGIAQATGDIIGILNSDDLYQDQNVLTDVMDEFKKHPDIDMLYGDLVYVKEEDTNTIVRNWKSKDYYPAFFEDGNVPPHPSLFIKNKVYKDVGLFNLNYKLAADYEFMLRAFKLYNYKPLHINRLMVRMRLGGATNKSAVNIINGNREIMRAWKDNGLKVPILLMSKRFFKRIVQFIQ
jgi:glycosyltransferase involved in cell wall biosynthesis